MVPSALRDSPQRTLRGSRSGCSVLAVRAEDGTVVVKSFRRETANAKAIFAERDSLRLVSHPLIANLVSTAQDTECIYIILEAHLGGPLHSHGRLAESAAKAYASHVALALRHIHSRKVIHRDVKLSNVVVDARGRAVLTDFGSAGLLGAAGAERETYCGTAHCMAPEMVLRQRHGANVDWWALGVLLAEMLQQAPPFWSENASALEHSILSGEANLPGHAPPATLSLLRRLLTRAPASRYDAAAVVAGLGLLSELEWQRTVDLDGPPFDRNVSRQRPKFGQTAPRKGAASRSGAAGGHLEGAAIGDSWPQRAELRAHGLSPAFRPLESQRLSAVGIPGALGRPPGLGRGLWRRAVGGGARGLFDVLKATTDPLNGSFCGVCLRKGCSWSPPEKGTFLGV